MADRDAEHSQGLVAQTRGHIGPIAVQDLLSYVDKTILTLNGHLARGAEGVVHVGKRLQAGDQHRGKAHRADRQAAGRDAHLGRSRSCTGNNTTLAAADEQLGLCAGRDAEFFSQHPLTELELPACRRRIVVPQVKLDQGSMGALLLRLERQPALGEVQGRTVAAVGGMELHQQLKRRGHCPAQGFALQTEPVLELRCIAQVETGEKIGAVEGNRFLEEQLARGVDSALRPMQPRVRQTLLESGHIRPQRVRPAEADRLAIGEHPVAADGAAQGVQDAPQPCPRPRLVEFGPEESCQHVAVMSAAGKHQVGQQRNGFLPVHRHRTARTLDERCAEEIELDIVCGGVGVHAAAVSCPGEISGLQRF